MIEFYFEFGLTTPAKTKMQWRWFYEVTGGYSGLSNKKEASHSGSLFD
jgi:hypothetical protein